MWVAVEDMVVEGGTDAVRTSVHRGEGGELSVMLEMFRVRDGRITELWGLSGAPRPRAGGQDSSITTR
ncbi:hypothetical protein [Streptomyces sp. RFCAC02]|uniref:hypothetical protein n=1 Tax=Streptomyces sp. RFCAC02 TaxID=2499143 RepID=UPI001021BFE9|nr:hypothetical protein [Streptomyces sp. RFCAC02]